MTYTPTGNPPGRPRKSFDRRKWAEAVKSLKALIANPKTMVEHKLRGVELLAMIYGIETPTTRTDKLAIRELLQRRNFDKAVAEGVDRTIERQDQEQEQSKMTQADLDDQERVSRLFNHALAGLDD